VIDKAFWRGESSVRISAGRRRYVINFNAMIQLNEDTSNRRPITLWLKNMKEDMDLLLPLRTASGIPYFNPESNGAGVSDSDGDLLPVLMPIANVNQANNSTLSLEGIGKENNKGDSASKKVGKSQSSKPEKIESDTENSDIRKKIPVLEGLTSEKVFEIMK